MKSFNINSTVKVRLTKVGEELLEKNWKDFWNSIGRLNPYQPPTPDADGYVEFQMWDLMGNLGEQCGWGGDLPFDTEILIDDKDLKGGVEIEENKLLKECRQTGRTTATTEKVLKTVFSQMTDKKTLECEIEEYALGIEQKAKEIGKLKDILDRKEQQLKQMTEEETLALIKKWSPLLDKEQSPNVKAMLIESQETKVKETEKVLKETEKNKTPCEKAFKRVYGYCPEVCERSVWVAFIKGYKSAQEDYKVGEFQPTPQEPKPMDDAIDRLVEKYKSQKLWNMIRNELGYSIDCCDEIVDLVEKWLPKEQSAEGSQNAFAIDATEGFNHCLNKIKGTLR